ncbi:MAG: ABC transporter ATP-binding protein [Eubacterium sp.]|nr:ABC transporter ATP-binding protein [Eubacterium sp.]
MSILTAKNLKKYYGSGSSIVKALNGVDLSVEKGEFTVIVGSSGSGKSTLLHLLGGLDTPTEGSIHIAGRELGRMDDTELTLFRRRQIGFVFQSFNLVPMLNVYENIVLPLDLDGSKIDHEFIREIVTMIGMEKKMQSMPNQLSGGEQQRVAIARALAAKPAILLADEPTGNLDSRTSQDVLGLLKNFVIRFGQAIIMITHNEAITQLADTIIRIEDGKIVESRWDE